MSSFAKLIAITLTAILPPVSLLAAASGAAAQEHCSGTLCDFYYGTSSSFDDKPAPSKAPTPVTVPKGTILGMFSGGNAQQEGAPGAAPAKRPLVGVGGGGIAALARGEKAEQCSGTLCELYYGTSSSFDDKPAQPATTAVPVSQVAAETAPDAAIETTPARRGFETRPEPARCASAGRDPWSCYR